MSRVSAAGGTLASITTAERGEQHGLPYALPGGKTLLFTVATSRDWSKANVSLLSVDSGERRVLIEGAADARYVDSGHLLFMKSGTLMAVPFDVQAQQVRGTPVPLIEGVMQAVNTPNGNDLTGAGQFAVSTSGTLLYTPGGVSPNLRGSWLWIDRAGAAQGRIAAPVDAYVFARLSPDGQRVAGNVRLAASRAVDIWIYDVRRGAPIRLTFDGTGSAPIWSPDGSRIVYASVTNGVSNLHVIGAGGGKPERLGTADQGQTPSSWVANRIAFLQRPTADTYGIWTLAMDDGRKPQLVLESRFVLSHAELSPDGRWLAYVSTESGGPEVYVQSASGSEAKVRVSTAGGTEPIWTMNGRELVYRVNGQDAQQYFAASVGSSSPFQIDVPKLLFEVKNPGYDSTTPIRSWNATPDGRQFLVDRFEIIGPPVTSMHLVLNWVDELRRIVR